MAGVQKIRRALRLVLLRSVKKIIATKRLSPRDVQQARIKNILFVCLQQRLSDLLPCTPTFRAVARSYPEALISLLVRPSFASLMGGMKEIDEVVVYGTWWRSLPQLARLARGRRGGFDLVVVLDDQACVESGLLAWITGAPFVLGSATSNPEGFEENFFYTLHSPRPGDGRHCAERHLDTVRYIGVKFKDRTEKVGIENNEKIEAVRFLQENGIEPGDVIVAVHTSPTAGEDGWQAHKFVSLLDHFGRKQGLQIILFRQQDHTSAEILEGLPFRPLEVCGCGLERKAALLSLCNVVITSDLETLHLAAAVGTPTVALWGSKDSKKLKPAGRRFVHLRANDSACTSIDVATVNAATLKLLTKYPKRVSDLPTSFDISEQAVNDALGFGDIAEDY